MKTFLTSLCYAVAIMVLVPSLNFLAQHNMPPFYVGAIITAIFIILGYKIAQTNPKNQRKKAGQRQQHEEN